MSSSLFFSALLIIYWCLPPFSLLSSCCLSIICVLLCCCVVPSVFLVLISCCNSYLLPSLPFWSGSCVCFSFCPPHPFSSLPLALSYVCHSLSRDFIVMSLPLSCPVDSFITLLLSFAIFPIIFLSLSSSLLLAHTLVIVTSRYLLLLSLLPPSSLLLPFSCFWLLLFSLSRPVLLAILFLSTLLLLAHSLFTVFFSWWLTFLVSPLHSLITVISLSSRFPLSVDSRILYCVLFLLLSCSASFFLLSCMSVLLIVSLSILLPHFPPLSPSLFFSLLSSCLSFSCVSNFFLSSLLLLSLVPIRCNLFTLVFPSLLLLFPASIFFLRLLSCFSVLCLLFLSLLFLFVIVSLQILRCFQFPSFLIYTIYYLYLRPSFFLVSQYSFLCVVFPSCASLGLACLLITTVVVLHFTLILFF